MYNPIDAHKGVKKEMRSFLLFCASIAVFLYFVSPTRDTDFSISEHACSNLNELWQIKYQNDFNFDDTWSFEPFECGTSASSTAHAFFLIDTMDVELPDGSKGFDFYGWMKKVNPVYSQRPMFGFSGVSYFERHQIDINIDKLNTSNPVEIAGILIHETRHIDQGFNSHAPCLSNKEIGCDTRLERDPLTGGAYNYNVVFYDQLARDADATRSIKKAALKLLESTLETKFNKTVDEGRLD